MIGKYIRNYRHLTRSVGNTPTKFLISVNNGYNQYVTGEAILIQDENTKTYSREKIHLFQTYYGNGDLNEICRRYPEKTSIVSSLFEKYHNCTVVNSPDSLRNLGCKIIILPDSFDADYLEFKKSNRKLFEPYFEKYGISEDRNDVSYLYCLCHDAPNLFTWAIKSIYGNRINTNYILRILHWNNNYNQLVNKLSKGTITAYNSREQILSLLNEMNILRRNKRANDMINIFNTNQKKLLKSVELTDHKYQILSKFGRLSKIKQVNFVRKMSTIDNIDEIFRQMAFLVDVHFEWNKESLLEYIKNSDGIICDIVDNSSDYILLRVHNYETIKRIAKNTNWCISKNKRYWNDYIDNKCGDATQYLMCDFSKKEDDKLSIVGFTITTNVGITSAHNFINENLMGNHGNRILPIKKIISPVNSIKEILESKKISLSKLMNYDEPDYAWTPDGFLEFLNSCVDSDNITIYSQEDNKMALSVKDNGIKYLFNERFEEILGNSDLDLTYFIFADFNKQSNDVDKIKVCRIDPHEDGVSSNESEVFNSAMNFCTDTFDGLLEDYNLPYTIIPRLDSNIARFMKAFRDFDIVRVKRLIVLKEIQEFLLEKQEEYMESMYHSINWSLVSYNSLDMLNVIYDSGLTLNLIFNKKYISLLAYSIFRGVSYDGRHRVFPLMANDKLIQEFYEDKIVDNITKLSVGLYIAFKKLLDNEPIEHVYERIGCRLGEFNNTELLFSLMEKAFETIRFNSEDELTMNYVKTVNSFSDKTLIDKIVEKDINNYNVLQTLVNCLNNRNPHFEELKAKLIHLKNSMPRKKKKAVSSDSDDVFAEFQVKQTR